MLHPTKANKQAIESLAPQVKELAEQLCEPVPKGDVRERGRRKRLEQLSAHSLRTSAKSDMRGLAGNCKAFVEI